MPRGGVPTVGLTLVQAEALVFDRTKHDSGRYYGPIDADLAIGVGLLYGNVQIPVYQPARRIFVVTSSTVLVLTHECDIDPDNAKLFNNDVLVAPLVPFENIFEGLKAERSDDEIRAYLGDLAAGRITQLMYLPHLPNEFPNGAVLYLNRITHTDVSEFSRPEVRPVVALTVYGLQQLDIRTD